MALGLEFYHSDSHEHLKRKKLTKLVHAQKVATLTNDYLVYCVLSLNLSWIFWMKTH